MNRPLLAISTCLAASLAMAQANNYPNGSTVADFTVTDTQGHTHNLYTYTAQGKYVMLDFFFAACGPCQATQPFFSQLHETYGCNAGDLVVLSINQGVDNDAEVIAYENTYGGSFQHAPAASSDGASAAVKTAFGVNAFPTYCLIGPDNKMVQNDIWPVSSMQSYVNAFPAASTITPQACAAAGVDEVGAGLTSSVWPVPSVGTVHVELPATGTVQAELRDAAGRLVRTERFDGPHDMDLSALADGQYTLALRDAAGARSIHRVVLAR
ncbi:MAG TPA: redoxin domain-containing protein [Flavobacteriales bacterium]|nr:redoxin domain-containing protein [Flavobacteriales bacterium]HRO40524.1 redoxin domain-containing protein [Flavobacteriales bacterium]HRP82588.1 redoxin domain-containing protein [Flavobacteriales bacterium]HRQ84944.1 redoxin domain-containing protein [Flavobacteriales bacterium]